MAQLDGIWWAEVGAGPTVVVPRLNIDWTAVDLSPLSDRFRVVVVAPRGFGPSVRPGAYDGTAIVGDIVRVLDHLGVGSCATFGYSMSGAMAARLAVADARVTAVACGGFPLTADLTGMAQRARDRHAAERRDPTVWADLLAALDPEAVVAFWEEVGTLPQAALADVACPVGAWWGEQDEVLAALLPSDLLRRDLEARGVAHRVVPGLDHAGMLDRIDRWLPDVAAWLGSAGGGRRRTSPRGRP